ncbi:MAG: ATP-dependent 6-phosphofructokinase [Holosporales bacterium]|jgi:6-phosphofructokinase 1|nr:ATP-dependent 6-phosphofructokinase [Holosporales bacterium]
MKKRLGIVTVGGDCSGLNSIIRGAVVRADMIGCELFGIYRGFFGLFPESFNCVSLTAKDIGEELLTSSGSILCSDTKSFTTNLEHGRSQKEILQLVCDGYKKLSLDGLIYIGGDGSLTILKELLDYAPDLMNVVAIPKTIDNDVNGTDFSVGFSTAVEVVADAISKVRSTAKSHQRTIIVEVMGRDAGFIALYAGVASGADIILVPEFEFEMSRVVSRVKENYDSGKKYCIIIVAEAVEAVNLKHQDSIPCGESSKYHLIKYKGIGQYIADYLKNVGFESRAVILGHIQRGGTTVILDRIIGTSFGVEAVNSLIAGERSIMLCYRGKQIEKISISELMRGINKRLDESDICVKIAHNLGVYIGESCSL